MILKRIGYRRKQIPQPSRERCCTRVENKQERQPPPPATEIIGSCVDIFAIVSDTRLVATRQKAHSRTVIFMKMAEHKRIKLGFADVGSNNANPPLLYIGRHDHQTNA